MIVNSLFIHLSLSCINRLHRNSEVDKNGLDLDLDLEQSQNLQQFKVEPGFGQQTPLNNVCVEGEGRCIQSQKKGQ